MSRSRDPAPGSPGVARWLLARLLPVAHRDAIIGDLDEEYRRHVAPERGVAAARWWYWRQALGSLSGLGARRARRQFRQFRSPRQERRRPVGRGLTQLSLDLRYGIRTLRRQPGFLVASVLLLAIGIGATTAMFSVVNAVLIRPLPYPDPGELLQLRPLRPGAEQHRFTFSEGEFLTYEERNRTLRGLAAFEADSSATLAGSGDPVQISGAEVTADLFAVLGVRPALGRTFRAQEDRPGGPAVAIIAHPLWQQMFGGDPAIVGTTVALDARPTTIVGVMPPGFRFPDDDTLYWAPLALERVEVNYNSGQILQLVGRRHPDATLAAVQEDLDHVSAQITDEALTRYPGMSALAVDLGAELAREVRSPLLLLTGVVAVVLVLVCFNLAGYLIAQGVARRRELAVRRALGASTGRIVRQLLSESFLLAAGGGVLGAGLAVACVRAVNAARPAFLDHVGDVELDFALLASALVATTVSALLCGLAPAVTMARSHGSTPLQSGRGAHSTRGAQRFLSGLVAAQIAACVVLLIGAGLMVRTLARERAIDPGFTVEGVLTFRVALPSERYTDAARINAFHDRALERIRALPAVVQAGGITRVPMGGSRSIGYAWQEGKAIEPGGFPQELNMRWATPGYFDTMGIELLSGHDFDGSHRPGQPLVAVVSESLAEALWPGQPAVGKRFKLGRLVDDDTPWRTVIGVVEEVRQNGPRDATAPTAYFAAAQRAPATLNVVVRASSSTSAATTLIEAVRAAIASVDPAQPIYDVRFLRELVAQTRSTTRTSAILLSGFSLLALLLAAIGLYALVAYSVRQRFHEIGVRRALGATGADVLKLVMGRAGRLTLAGVGIGVAGALATTRLLDSLVFGVSTTDPGTFAATCAAVVMIALAVALVPARRAAGIEPRESLRQ